MQPGLRLVLPRLAFRLDLALVIAISSFVIWMVRTVVPLLQVAFADTHTHRTLCMHAFFSSPVSPWLCIGRCLATDAHTVSRCGLCGAEKGGVCSASARASLWLSASLASARLHSEQPRHGQIKAKSSYGRSGLGTGMGLRVF